MGVKSESLGIRYKRKSWFLEMYLVIVFIFQFLMYTTYRMWALVVKVDFLQEAFEVNLLQDEAHPLAAPREHQTQRSRRVSSRKLCGASRELKSGIIGLERRTATKTGASIVTHFLGHHALHAMLKRLVHAPLNGGLPCYLMRMARCYERNRGFAVGCRYCW